VSWALVRGRRAKHAGRKGEDGLTLIELVATMAIMAVTFVAVLSAISTVELMIGTTKQDALLASAARQVETYITTSNLHYYTACESPTGATAYTTALQYAASAGKLVLPSGYVPSAVAVALPLSSSSVSYDVVNGAHAPLAPIPACSSDYGVQQIKFKVSSPGARQSVVRIVYKRWNQ